MTDATAPDRTPPDTPATRPGLLTPEDAAVVQYLRQEYPLWRTEKVPHAACKAAVDLLFPIEGKKCGETKGYRIQDRVRDAPEPQAAPSSAPAPEVLPPPEPPEDTQAPIPLPAESSPAPPADDLDEDAGKPSGGWLVILVALGAFITIWSGWVGIGKLTGFGIVQPFPGIVDWRLNTAIALPIGVEAYAAYALGAWLSGRGSRRTRVFARNSAFGTLVLGVAGQCAYHLLEVQQAHKAPWPVTLLVSCLPVVCLGTAAALHHMISTDRRNYLRSQKKGKKK